MFDSTKCDLCGECLAKCQYLNFDYQKGAQEFNKLLQKEETEWLNSCITCFACNEYCPNGAKPFDLICQRIEERGGYVQAEALEKVRKQFIPQGDFKAAQATGPAISLCTVHSVVPRAFQGSLFEGVTFLKGRHYFCNVLFMHLGNMSLLRHRAETLINNYAQTGAKEVIFVHDDCYTFMTMVRDWGISLPFRPVHIFEYLLNYLKKHKKNLRRLNMRVAYQRPCASRYTPEKEWMLDEIFSLIGVERAERQYDRINALCCGQDLNGLMGARKGMDKFQEMNVLDALKNGARGMVFLCPMCLDALQAKCKEKKLTPYFITDFCGMALGESIFV